MFILYWQFRMAEPISHLAAGGVARRTTSRLQEYISTRDANIHWHISKPSTRKKGFEFETLHIPTFLSTKLASYVEETERPSAAETHVFFLSKIKIYTVNLKVDCTSLSYQFIKTLHVVPQLVNESLLLP